LTSANNEVTSDRVPVSSGYVAHHPTQESNVLRYTVRDSEKTVSFTGERELAPYLVAACASKPALFEDLLLATQRFSPEIVQRVMNQLLATDRGIEAGVDPSLFDAFEVFDETTARRAMKPEADGIITIDLDRHAIAGTMRGGTPLAARGSVRVRLPGNLERETVYALGQDWSVDIRVELPASAVIDAYA
jgi:hypothetical protein